MTNSGPRPTKNEKREHAREQARVFREQQQKKQRQRRLGIQAGVLVVVLAIVAVVVVVVVNNNHATNVKKAKQVTAGPANMLSDGILLTGSGGKITAVKTAAVQPKAKPVATDLASYSGKANIVEYIDFQCPYCDQFETSNLANINKWVEAGKATVEIHPLSFLDGSSGTNRYSSRAANAAACVAAYDPNDFLSMVKTLYANQPAENTGGMPDDKLIGYVKSSLNASAATSSTIASCIAGEKYKSWVAASTARANIDVFGGTVDSSKISTPTVFVNGQQYPASTQTWLTDPTQFTAFVEKTVPGATS
jgi:protein-disulfide isomerase